MNRADDFPENLAIRARRGDLSHKELAELQRWLQESATLRVTYQIGRDFDRLAAVQAGDEACVARFVAGALKSRHRGPLASADRV